MTLRFDDRCSRRSPACGLWFRALTQREIYAVALFLGRPPFAPLRRAEGAATGEPPFAACVLGGDPLDVEAETSAHGLYRLIDLGSVGEHGNSVGRADVIQVDVHRQPRHVEDEQIQCGAALE